MIVAALPQAWTRKFVSDDRRAYDLNVLISSLLVAAVVMVVVRIEFPCWCLFVLVINEPGPCCFMMRSIDAALTMQVAPAWEMHPMGPLVAAVVAIQIPLRSASLLEFRLMQALGNPRFSSIINQTLAAACVLVWIVRQRQP